MAGQTIGHYRIVRKIGEGGVGHVYLADDLQLNRQVALKVLAHPSPDSDQIARFEREARAAAALDHPNILAIHDFGHDRAIPYVVMELLDGANLRQRLASGRLPVRTAVEYAIEILRGLAAAHDKGIWHRDLKPENIFITRDERVKILDFGLANVHGSEAAFAADGLTREALTKPGVVLGTVGYMAPEQVAGDRVDGRADLFAFGAVLFEMLTARRAFAAPTPVETLHDILKADTPLGPLEDARVPGALVQIVSRCLEKARERRFQSAREVVSALQAALPAIGTDPPAAGAAGSSRLDSWKEIAAFLGRGVRTVQRWEREEQLPVRRLEHAKRGSVFADREEIARWWERRQRTTAEAPVPAPTTPLQPQGPLQRPSAAAPIVERVTGTTGFTVSPALSSDGRMVVCVSNGGRDDAVPQVWLQQIGGGAMRLTTDLRDCVDPGFSADDTKVLFTAAGDAGVHIYAVPTLGGEPRIVKRNAKGGRMSPDGRWLAYLPLPSSPGCRIAACDGGVERTLAADLTNASSIVWAPDSRHLLVQAHPDPQFERDYWIVSVDGGPASNTGIVGRFRANGTVIDMAPAWTADSIVFTGADRNGVLLWRQRLAPGTFEPVGGPEPLTRGTEWAVYPAARANRLVYVSTRNDVNLWTVDLDAATGLAGGAPRRMTRGPGILAHLCLGAAGRTLAYFRTGMGMPSPFVRDLDSGSETVIDAAPANAPRGYPAVSRTGRYIAYSTMVPGPRAVRPVFVLDQQTGEARQVCDDCGGRPRAWLDDATILVETFAARLNAFLRVDANAGAQRPFVASSTCSLSNPRLSTDGSMLAFDAAEPGRMPAVFVARLAGDTPIAESDWTRVADGASHPFWSTDGRLLYYLPVVPNRDLRSVVRARRVDTSGRPEGDSFLAATLTERLIPTVLAGTAPVIAREQMICVLADLSGDVWMMSL